MNIPAPWVDEEIQSELPDPLEELIALEEEAIAMGVDVNHHITEKLK
jgi:hypothetical protein